MPSLTKSDFCGSHSDMLLRPAFKRTTVRTASAWQPPDAAPLDPLQCWCQGHSFYGVLPASDWSREVTEKGCSCPVQFSTSEPVVRSPISLLETFSVLCYHLRASLTHPPFFSFSFHRCQTSIAIWTLSLLTRAALSCTGASSKKSLAGLILFGICFSGAYAGTAPFSDPCSQHPCLLSQAGIWASPLSNPPWSNHPCG